MPEELNVISRTYDFTIWMLNHLGKFPRDHRHGLGKSLETKLFRLLDLLIEAKYTRSKSDALQQASLLTEQIRFQLRMARELRLISIKSHDYSTDCLIEISRQVAGWKKFCSAATEEREIPAMFAKQ